MGNLGAWMILLVLTACSGGGSPSTSENKEVPNDAKAAPELAPAAENTKNGKDKEAILTDYAQRLGQDRATLQQALEDTGSLELIGQAAASAQDLEKLSAFLLQSHEGFAVNFLAWAKANDIAAQPKFDFAAEVQQAKMNDTALVVSQVPVKGMVLPSAALRDTLIEELRQLGIENLKILDPSEFSAETAAKMMAAVQEAMDQRVTLANNAKAQQGAQVETQVEPDQSSGGLAYALCLKLDRQMLAFLPVWNGDKPGLQWIEVEHYALPLKPLKAPAGFAEGKKQALELLLAKDPLNPGDQFLKVLLEEQLGLSAHLVK